MSSSTNTIRPCRLCIHFQWCPVPKKLNRIHHPWATTEVEYEEPFIDIVRAETCSTGMHVVLQCRKFKEKKDAS